MVEIKFKVEAIADELGFQFRACNVEDNSVLWVKLSSLGGKPIEKVRNNRYSALLCDARESGQMFSAKCEIFGHRHVIKELKEIRE